MYSRHSPRTCRMDVRRTDWPCTVEGIDQCFFFFIVKGKIQFRFDLIQKKE